MIKLIIAKGLQNPSSEALDILLSKTRTERSNVQIGSKGKPFLKNGPYFNISHTADIAAIAIASHPVGIDIEQIRPMHANFTKRILSEHEYRWYISNGEMDADLIQFWTLKESYYKYIGIGLSGFPNQTEFFYSDAWHLKGSHTFFHTIRRNNYQISICSGLSQPIDISIL